ncbi:hypothetical protein KC340_g10802 [Hortaea werneckii]|nr:hypothetical protein KC342_g11050 [Hortaea werneckii]KAI7065315.1 hypothetical protein KC339_g15814 [Hortaea werneckii]KAI7218646.1 hypothetical protein KC365_g12560 [Hortaea werneckii]KAI7309290.1 hypothetical protein KC340_g10802 [Hortaea werneckii]KAI7379130.1 hypothetical protein KC328_g13504 [Hortaea werneckii]
MSGAGEEVADDAPVKAPAGYSILKQKVDLDVDFPNKSLKGSTEITVQPLVKDARNIRLHCRQCRPTSIQAGGITAKYEYDDPYRRLRMPPSANVHQHDTLKKKIANALQPAPEPELSITLPAKLAIQQLHVDPTNQLPRYNETPSLQKQESDAMAVAEGTAAQPTSAPQGPQFAPIKLFIEFEVMNFRDGVHWIGCDEEDKRYPHMYTKPELWPGNTSSIFPCVDDATSRCSWEISIHCPRTVGDAFRQPGAAPSERQDPASAATNGDVEMTDGSEEAQKPDTKEDPEYLISLGEDEAAMDLSIVCVGEQTDDVADTEDDTRHTVTYTMIDPVTARHVGFAIGPFERVDLSSTREAEDEERLGQSAVKIDGFCLPGRGEEVRNTCWPLTRVIDHFGVNYGSFPFSSYQVLFVDDLVHDTVATAGLSFCSSRLLFPEGVIEPLEPNTRVMIRAVAEQWMGVNVIPKEPTDAWVVSGIAGYMTDLYGKMLFGNNAYRWQQKLASEKVYELDADRPSIHQHGLYLHLDKSIRDFLALKSALVLFILDRRLLKISGSTGMQRILNKVFLNAKTGNLENGEISTEIFHRTCERVSHNNKLEPFFRQWVFGAGCPIFSVTQRFNKKKTMVEMQIVQRQMDRRTKPEFAPDNFMREIKEHLREVWAEPVQPVFTGPMTIRIHEADGTPYEHIVEIKEQVTKLEIPYNTKYKRLKRSRRQKERAMADGQTGEGGEDALLYCLGDILDSPEEVKDWNLVDWTEEDEEKMGQESYEWIRMDADFEWIGKMHLVMPLYMYISQLQQDRDLVAQYESMRYLMGSNPHHVSLSILVRTLMDRRYFHGIRTMAAEGLAILAKGDVVRDIGRFHLTKAFEEMFCFPGELMPRPNDFSDRVHYIMQCAIPRAMSKLRDAEGKVPMSIRKFFMDKLRFNDNSENEFSDCHYMATLMDCLGDSLIASHREPEQSYTFTFGEDEPMEPENPDEPFEREAIDLIERFRRIDEFDQTYHNVYSLTALDCLQKLTNAGLVKDKTKEVLQYTRPSNANLVRLQAFRCLTETGVTRKISMLRYMLQSIVDDSSPHFRNKLLGIFGEALGHIALGDAVQSQAAPAPTQMETDGLVLEQEASSEARHLEATRRTTPEGAIEALKQALLNEPAFKEALWYSATSPDIGLDEVAAFCDVAALVYPPIASCLVTMKLPRKYRCEKVGKATVRFTPHGPYRTKPIKPLSIDDWQAIEDFGLKYTGPVAKQVQQRRKSSLDEDVPLKLKIPTMNVDTSSTKGAETPSEAKSGIKLSLGALKRKQSVEASQRAGSPKLLKTSAQQSPASGLGPAPPKSRSPSLANQRRGSTAGPKASIGKQGGSKIVKLRMSGSAMSRVRDMLARPPRPGRPKSLTQDPSRSSTPAQKPKSSLFPNPHNSLPSPTATSPFSASPSMNLGGFRSYGAAAPDANANGGAPEVKRKKSSDATAAAPTTAMPSASASPVGAANGAGAMAPPPKPKLKLKLGRKPSEGGSAAGSPS